MNLRRFATVGGVHRQLWAQNYFAGEGHAAISLRWEQVFAVIRVTLCCAKFCRTARDEGRGWCGGNRAADASASNGAKRRTGVLKKDLF